MNPSRTILRPALFVRALLCASLLFLLEPAAHLRSDPLVIVRAMTATTVAEIYVEQDSVLVEIEIGVADLPAFRNLMPDEIFERMGNEAEPLASRIPRFFQEDLVIRPENGAPLPGRVLDMTARPRIRRDEITGEPLPVEDPEAELTVFVRLSYRFSGQPDAMVVKPPATESGMVAANIGFALYHRGLPVNDFRYLSRSERVQLDWTDPWFSQFDNRNLWRQYNAPINAYLYVEPYEVRKEIVVRPRDLEQWIDLGIGDRQTITVAEQEELKRRVTEFLADRNPVLIDGRPVEGQLDRINFIYRTLRTSGVIDPPRDLDVHSATLGVIFVYLVDGLPEQVSMRWELFNDRFPRVPAATTDEAGGLPYFLTPDDQVLRWQNFLTNPTVPGLVEVGAPPRRSLLWVLLAVAAVTGLAYLVIRYGPSAVRGQVPARPALAATLALLVLAVVSVPRSISSAGVSDARAEEIVGGLLMNTYRAFDYRVEDRIYDTLDLSISGDLLTQVYLETRRSLELENQGGARVKVKNLEMLSSDARGLRGEPGFTTHSVWNVAGSVGHWGHVHQRINQYEARLTIQAIDGVWKITDLDLIQETRL